MKKISMIGISFLGMVAVVTVMFFNACTSDPCKDVNCGVNGNCVDGTCVCVAGYEGANCETEMRTKFEGTWTTSDACSQSGNSSYLVTITAGTGITEVKITNFWDVFTNAVVATVDGTTISIASQQPDNDDFFVTGQGTISGNTITWNYTIDDQGIPSSGTDVCSSTWTK